MGNYAKNPVFSITCSTPDLSICKFVHHLTLFSTFN